MDLEDIIFFEEPNLNQPYLIIGFEGWPNAAEISTFATQHLIDRLEAKVFATMECKYFYDFSSHRPSGVIKEGTIVEIKLPTNYFYYSKKGLSKDIIIFQGTEPHIYWHRFVENILNLALHFEVPQIITIGGTYDLIPHYYPAKVSALFNHQELKEKVLKAGIRLTEYSGPISIHTFILEEARLRGMKAISLWGHAPQYLQAKNVKVVHGVLEGLFSLLGEEIDLYPLHIASEYFDQQINQLIEKDPKLKDMIQRLDETYREEEKSFISSNLKEEKKDEKVIYIQAFLKRQEDEDKKEE